MVFGEAQGGDPEEAIPPLRGGVAGCDDHLWGLGRSTGCNMWSFKLREQEWALFITEGDSPPGRENPSAIVWESQMIMFAGKDDDAEGFFSDTWLLDLSSRKWKLLSPSGEGPKGRWDHSAVLWKDVMMMFGGRDEQETLDDMWTLDLKAQQWTLLSPKGSLPGRLHGHSAVVWSDHMVVFGGSSSKGRTNQAWHFNWHS